MKSKNKSRSESGIATMEYFVMATAVAMVVLLGFPMIVQNIDDFHSQQAAELSANTSYPKALIP